MDKLQKQSNREQMAQLIEQCDKSGKSIKGYCLENNIAEWKYYYWKHRFEQDKRKDQAGFVPIRKQPEPHHSGQIIIEYPNGTKLHVSAGMPASQIAALIRIS